ncbi:MAG: hypothetical protein ACK55I_05210, partial [bacterium]
LHVVLFHPEAIVVERAHVELGTDVAAFGLGPEFLQRCRIIPCLVGGEAGVEIRVPQYTKRFAGLKPPAGKSVVLCNENACD